MEPQRILIRVGAHALEAELNGSATASLVYDVLPVRARGQRWGDEIYFEIPVSAATSPDARDVMEVGELAYWSPGNAFCIFFGPTPASSGGEPRAASPVNPLGQLIGDATVLASVASGTEVIVEKA